MNSILKPVKHPDMRAMLLDALSDLSDKDYQKINWVKPSNPYGFYSSFKMAYAVLFYDLGLDDGAPEEQIGFSLYNNEELGAVMPVVESLNMVFEKIGFEKPDSAYINSPLWDRVVEASQKALAVFMKNEDEARKLNPVPWNGEDDWGAA